MRPGGNIRAALLAAVALALWALTPAVRAVPLEVYGGLPHIENVALSPEGDRIAFVRTDRDQRLLAVVSMADRRMIAGLRLGEVKLRSVGWADNDNLLLTTSATTFPWGLLGTEREWYVLDVYNVSRRHLQHVPQLSPYIRARITNVVTGHVMVRRIKGHTVLFVPGIYYDPGPLPALFRHDLDSGSERLLREGTRSTRSWIVDANGGVAAEEDYDDANERWAILVSRNGRMREVASGHEAIDYPSLYGFGPGPDTLLAGFIEQGDPVWRLLSIKDGSIGAPLPQASVLDSPIEDQLRDEFIGGVRVDDDTHYVFFDPAMQSRWQAILSSFPGEHVVYVSSAANFTKFVVRVEGPRDGYRYVLVDLRSRRAEPVGEVYEGLKHVLEVRRITYPAADGLEIPAYLTLPADHPPRALPLIVLPHGGPAVRDTADFDWWSQALAEQGYAVLRPNYRGSNLGRRYISAGFGEWGRKMQTDLSDGVRYLAREGIVDPARVCIMGASYGGYAALAGVTLDPGVYRCAVAVSGISDLPEFVQAQQATSIDGSHVTTRFWDRFMGASRPGDPILWQLSPLAHAAAVNVPVLLIHGRDDTVVPFRQSERMYEALQRAHRSVELVTLKHEDHWLSRGETRLQMLESSVAFLRAHNPPG